MKVKGLAASHKADDITLAASTTDGTKLGNQKFSVVSVSITMRSQRPETVSSDDLGNDEFATVTGQELQPGARALLGLLFIKLHTKGVPNPNAGCALGAEFAGSVTPPDYKGKITVRREMIAGNLWRDNSDIAESTGLSDDTSADSQLLTKDVQSAKDGQGNIVGTVYDLDAPVPGQEGLFATVLRYRANFREYAELGDWNRGSPKSIAEQASDDFFGIHGHRVRPLAAQ